MNSDRSIQTLRGLACLLLVFYHVVGSDASTGMRVESGPLRLICDGLTCVRMPLFTFLSGVVYDRRPFAGDPAGFVVGKARRLLVPMLFVGTLFALVQSVAPDSNYAVRDWRLLHVEPVGHFWFVEALFWVFAATMALERLGLLTSARSFAGCWIGAAILYLTLRGTRWFGLEGAIYLLPYFLFGVAVSRFALLERMRRPGAWVVAATVASISIVAIGAPLPNPDRRTVWMLLAGVSLCSLLIGLRVESRWLARVGASSYSIYVLHVFFTAATRMALDHAGVSALAPHCLAALAAGIAGPTLVDRWASPRPWARLLLLGQSPAHSPGALQRSGARS